MNIVNITNLQIGKNNVIFSKGVEAETSDDCKFACIGINRNQMQIAEGISNLLISIMRQNHKNHRAKLAHSLKTLYTLESGNCPRLSLSQMHYESQFET